MPALDFRLNTLPKVNRIRLPHPGWPPGPASILNQISDSLGIPFRFLFHARRSRTASRRVWLVGLPWQVGAVTCTVPANTEETPNVETLRHAGNPHARPPRKSPDA